LLHATELPVTISWLVDCVMVGGQLPGVPLGDGVGVGVGGGVPPPQIDLSTVAVSLEPLYPVTTRKLFPSAVPPVKECATFVFGPGLQLSATVS
jgi:hypothetical protein